MTSAAEPDVDELLPATCWAGPALVTSPDAAADATLAVLALWPRYPPDPAGTPDGDLPARVAEALRQRGFARLPGPAPEQLRALPQLSGIGVRLSADGRLRLGDGSRTLFEGARFEASDDWHATARAGRLVLLVDVQPNPDGHAPDRTTPDQDALDGDALDGDALDGDALDGHLAARALARLTAACRARSVFGARIAVTGDDTRPPATPG